MPVSAAFARLSLVLLTLVTLPACELAEGIFKAGMGVGIFLVVLVVALVFFLIGKVRRHV
jgi:hypothetical protein